MAIVCLYKDPYLLLKTLWNGNKIISFFALFINNELVSATKTNTNIFVYIYPANTLQSTIIATLPLNLN